MGTKLRQVPITIQSFFFLADDFSFTRKKYLHENLRCVLVTLAPKYESKVFNQILKTVGIVQWTFVMNSYLLPIDTQNEKDLTTLLLNCDKNNMC